QRRAHIRRQALIESDSKHRQVSFERGSQKHSVVRSVALRWPTHRMPLNEVRTIVSGTLYLPGSRWGGRATFFANVEALGVAVALIHNDELSISGICDHTVCADFTPLP